MTGRSRPLLTDRLSIFDGIIVGSREDRRNNDLTS